MRVLLRAAVFTALALFLVHPRDAARAAPPPPADQVFVLSVERVDDARLRFSWDIAPGNYLYRDSIKAKADSAALPTVTEAGEEKDDPNFGLVEVYHGRTAAEVDVGAARADRITVTYQGCAEQGVCYPPLTKTVDLMTLAVEGTRPGLGGVPAAPGVSSRTVALTPPTMPKVTVAPVSAAPSASNAPSSAVSTPAPAVSEAPAVAAPADVPQADNAPGALLSGSLGWMLASFFGFGLLLALTPCVLPMVPILAGMLAKSGEKLSPARGFALSGAYVVAMAGAYGLLGFAAGWSGANLQAALQTPWALGLMAAVFVALALSMFGLFDLALPAGLANRLSRGGAAGGSLAGAAILGFGSALIVGPCVTPPLAAAMLYAAQTGEAGKGAAALFMLGLGMGVPLLAVGTFGVGILPKSGPWLAKTKEVFGFVFLAVAVYLVARLLPGPIALGLWGVVAIAAGAFLGAFDRLSAASAWYARLGKATGLAASVYGAALIVGFAGGASDPMRPLGFLAGGAQAVAAAHPVTTVTSIPAFEAAVADKVGQGRPILVSFTADWCTVCKSNEAVLETPAVRARLDTLPIIKVDVTAYGDATRALMERFSVVGPPTLFLIDGKGEEVARSRIIGELDATDFLTRLEAAGA